MKLATLYKKRSDGGVQKWEIEVEGDRFRTISGTLDGAQVTSEWTVAKAKNEGRSNATTPEQQALFETQSMWQKKRDKGYYESIEAGLANEDFYKVMLANEYEKRKARGKVVFPVYSQPKLDGMRLVDLPKGPYSRGGKVIVSAPHIREACEKLRELAPGLELDGELYCDRLSDDFDTLMSIARKTKLTPDDVERSTQYLEYHVYDCPSATGNFSQRYQYLVDLFKRAGILDNPTSHIKLVKTDRCDVEADLDALFKVYLTDGYEGQIVRLDQPYQHKRCDAVLKRKIFKEEEFLIVEVLEGERGNRYGMAGRINMALPDGRTFGVDPMGTRSFRKRLWLERSVVQGKKGTVRFFDYTPDGKPRFGKLKCVRDYE